ncbi:MAG: glutaredoxin domain-containing protein [Candidatus Woesearchaeota archaeon]
MNKQLYMAVAMIALLALTGCASSPNGNAVADINDDPEKVVVYFFWGEGCPHCATEKSFLEEMEQEYPEVEVKMFETWKNPENAGLFQELARAYGFQARGVPTTFIGEEHWVGYNDAMGEEMEAVVQDCIENDCPNPGDKVQ